MKIKYLFGALLLAQAGGVLNAQKASIYTSSEEAKWQRADVEVQKQADPNADVIISTMKEQAFEGFGGTFGELGWDALSLLSQEKRNEVMRGLFGREGIHFAYGRIPMGANDFAREWYSCNETEGDFEMKHFTIERDRQIMIPYVKAALKENPKLKLWTSPWSPPVWMKVTKHYATAAGDHNDFTKENEVEGDHLIQQPEYLEAYALYQSKFVEEYRKNGIKISSLQFQNEPYTVHQWPNCRWMPQTMANFIGKYLGPLFSKKHPDVELWFGTFNCNKMEDLDCIMQDADAARYVRGVGLQWEGKDIIAEIHRKYPSMKLMQTENECGSGSIDWGAAEHTYDLVETYLNGGANVYMYFNMVLQDNGASSWGWTQNSLVRVDSSKKDYFYTPEYYLMKHLNHFIKPGAHKVKVRKGNGVLAFRNPDGQTVIFCINKDAQARDIRISCKNSTLTVSMKPKTFNTIVY